MRIRIPFALACALMLAPRSVAAQEDVGLFSVDLGLSLWTIVVFLLLLWVLRRYAWGPILSGLETRERTIQESIDEANQLREEAHELLDQHRKQLAEARKEAQQILTEAREAGDRLRREIEDSARQESERILDRARREVALERDRALDEIRRESVDLALAAATKLLRERIDAETNRELVIEALQELQSPGVEA